MSQTSPGQADDRAARQLMCEIGRRIWQRGLCAGNEGNHSMRIAPDRILCTPTNMSKGFMHEDDICELDLSGQQAGGRRQASSEFRLHLEVYRQRPDVGAVVHGHPPHATVFALANLDLPCGFYPEAEVLLGPVRCTPYVIPGDERLPESIRPYLKDTTAILLGNHGAVTYDVDLEAAYHRFEVLDAYARIVLLSRQVGPLRQLTGAEMAELFELKQRMGLRDPRMQPAQPAGNACLFRPHC